MYEISTALDSSTLSFNDLGLKYSKINEPTKKKNNASRV